MGINNFRVQYTAGYATVPDDVQEACAELVATLWKDLGRNQNRASENISGIAYSALTSPTTEYPKSIRTLLAPYREYNILDNMG